MDGKTIMRPVEILAGVREIAGFLKVGIHKARRLEALGAPIAKDDNGVMRAEKAELWDWWMRRHLKGAQTGFEVK